MKTHSNSCSRHQKQKVPTSVFQRTHARETSFRHIVQIFFVSRGMKCWTLFHREVTSNMLHSLLTFNEFFGLIWHQFELFARSVELSALDALHDGSGTAVSVAAALERGLPAEHRVLKRSRLNIVKDPPRTWNVHCTKFKLRHSACCAWKHEPRTGSELRIFCSERLCSYDGSSPVAPNKWF